MKGGELERHISDFLADFRASKRPFVAGEEPCVACGKPSETYCECCHAALCLDDADIEAYGDVDVCANMDACAARSRALEDGG